jgi:hypothetical protein
MMSEFTDLALEIQQDTGLDFDAAYRLAWQQMPELLNDVLSDLRYRPCRVIVFDLLTPRELKELTDVRYIPRRVVMLDHLMTAAELKALTDR